MRGPLGLPRVLFPSMFGLDICNVLAYPVPDRARGSGRWGAHMIVTNLDHIPDREVIAVLGMVNGFSAGEKKDEDYPAFVNGLFEEAERALLEKAEGLGADAILGVSAAVMAPSGKVREVLLLGTAVVLGVSSEEPGHDISLSLGGNRLPWSQPPATPTSDVVRMIRQKGRAERDRGRKRKDIYDLADEIGISYDRAKILVDSGFENIDDIANASTRDLSVLEGINPTQARILKRRAQEILEMEREL
ncbi:MAG TPA: heavy metal-binding domain-containing protein [Euryarchaeota archaeon]|nr:heavy metal-binding domain-containing protein [Euryarchaeota archaeon]